MILYSIKDICVITKLTRRTIDRLKSESKFPQADIKGGPGKQAYWNRSTVYRWLRQQEGRPLDRRRKCYSQERVR